MPCCWPPTATASTSSSPPASRDRLARARPTTRPGRPPCRPGGRPGPRGRRRPCRRRGRRPCRTAWRSRPRRRAPPQPRMPYRCSSASWSSRSNPIPRRPAASGSNASFAQVGDGLARGEGRLRQLVDAGVGQRLLHLRVGAEGPHLLAQDQVVAHAALGGGPHPGLVLGARRLEVEVPGAVVAAVLHDVDGPERPAGVAGAEAQVLVVARAGLAVEVDVEELAVPQRLGQAVGVVQRRPSPRGRPRGSRRPSRGGRAR